MKNATRRSPIAPAMRLRSTDCRPRVGSTRDDWITVSDTGSAPELMRLEVVRLLKVIDARQLEEDLVLAHRLDHRLRDAEAVDATVDHAPRAVVVVGDALAGRDLAGVHLEEELGPALEVKPEVGLDLLVDLDRAQVEADAGAGRWKRERELMFRDVEEDRQHEDHEDEPGEGAVHKKKFRG